MAQVTITVHELPYQVVCEEGQEEHAADQQRAGEGRGPDGPAEEAALAGDGVAGQQRRAPRPLGRGDGRGGDPVQHALLETAERDPADLRPDQARTDEEEACREGGRRQGDEKRLHHRGARQRKARHEHERALRDPVRQNEREAHERAAPAVAESPPERGIVDRRTDQVQDDPEARDREEGQG